MRRAAYLACPIQIVYYEFVHRHSIHNLEWSSIMKQLAILVALIGLILPACNTKKETEPPKELQTPPPSAMPEGHPGLGITSVAGVQWTKPARWTEGPARTMRVATYVVPAAEGDAEGGECGVFYFGSGQGGDVQMNIDRWAQQFENPRGPERTTKAVNGLNVVMVKIAGTYLAPGGPMMQATGKHENYRLLGAIVAAPEGSVFFKLTGPAKTIGAAERDFDSLVASLRAVSPR